MLDDFSKSDSLYMYCTHAGSRDPTFMATLWARPNAKESLKKEEQFTQRISIPFLCCPDRHLTNLGQLRKFSVQLAGIFDQISSKNATVTAY
jgi:hypothetical protein